MSEAIAVCPLVVYNGGRRKGWYNMEKNIVTVKVDRALGTFHPKHPALFYPVNYGYVEGIMAPDGEEQDAYILGVAEPVAEFTGKVIAVIRRKDDVEDKWVVVPEHLTFTKDEIRRQVEFQEQYFDVEIEMMEEGELCDDIR